MFQGEEGQRLARLADHCRGFVRGRVGVREWQAQPARGIAVFVRDGDREVVDVDVHPDRTALDVRHHLCGFFVHFWSWDETRAYAAVSMGGSGSSTSTTQRPA